MSLANASPRSTIRWWHWPHLLSFDAPLVALTWLVLWKSSYRLYAVDDLIYWLLLWSVWLIYLTDRLLDSSGIIRNSTLETRHSFLHKFQRWLWLFVLLQCLWSTGQAMFFLRLDVVIAGFYLLVLVGLYFAHRVLMPLQVVAILPKEIFCGILFAMGTALAPRVLAHNLNFAQSPSFNASEILLGFGEFIGKIISYDVIPVALLFSMNIIAIACWEWIKKPDHQAPNQTQQEAQDDASLVSIVPELPRALPWLLILLATASALAGILWGYPNTNPIYLCVTLSSLALWGLNCLRNKLSRLSIRVLADVCLLTPWLVIPFLR